MRSIGLDVGRHVTEVAISEPGRGTRSGGRIGASPESLEAFAATLSADDQVVLMRNLVSCPWSDAFGAGGRAWLAEVELPTDEREQVDRSLRLLEGLDA